MEFNNSIALPNQNLCECCKGRTELKDLTLGFQLPDYLFDVSRAKQKKSLNAMPSPVMLKIYNEERYFIRGCINFHVFNERRPYIIGIWIEVSKDDFEIAKANNVKTTISGTIANQTKFSPLFGLPCTMRLELSNDQDPITLTDSNNIVTTWQKNGISRHTANSITLSRNEHVNDE